MNCPKCGALLEEDSKFCTSCGANLESNQEVKFFVRIFPTCKEACADILPSNYIEL